MPLDADFLLVLAWACTAQVQGLTLVKDVVSLQKVFTAGQVYAALSHVASLENLIM